MGNRYFGSKATFGLCQPLIALMPPYAVYIETHLGGGALMQRKPAALRNIGVNRDAAALSVFFMQSPSFLAHQRSLAERRGRSNAHTPFGLRHIPSDNRIRQMLDGTPPSHFNELFTALAAELDAGGVLDGLRCLDGRTLIALDGTEYFRSGTIHCPNCSTRKRNNGETEYFHQLLAATLVAPGRNLALPLPPEFLAPREGTTNRTASAPPPNAGSPASDPNAPRSARYISATTCTPASPSARPSATAADTSCSAPSPPATKLFMNICKASPRTRDAHASAGARNSACTATAGCAACPCATATTPRG